jgi:hypothetical protein
VDLDLPGMGMVADGAAGINPYMVKAQATSCPGPGHQVPECNPGKLRVRVPWQGFRIDCLAICSHDFMPYGFLGRVHCVHTISNFIETVWTGQGYIPYHFKLF